MHDGQTHRLCCLFFVKKKKGVRWIPNKNKVFWPEIYPFLIEIITSPDLVHLSSFLLCVDTKHEEVGRFSFSFLGVRGFGVIEFRPDINRNY